MFYEKFLQEKRLDRTVVIKNISKIGIIGVLFMLIWTGAYAQKTDTLNKVLFEDMTDSYQLINDVNSGTSKIFLLKIEVNGRSEINSIDISDSAPAGYKELLLNKISLTKTRYFLKNENIKDKIIIIPVFYRVVFPENHDAATFLKELAGMNSFKGVPFSGEIIMMKQFLIKAKIHN